VQLSEYIGSGGGGDGDGIATYSWQSLKKKERKKRCRQLLRYLGFPPKGYFRWNGTSGWQFECVPLTKA